MACSRAGSYDALRAMRLTWVRGEGAVFMASMMWMEARL
jgi:hypothetical protein